MNLKSYRRVSNLTQKELAEKCGVSRSAINQIERGVNLPSVPLAKKLGKVLGFKWTDFFND